MITKHSIDDRDKNFKLLAQMILEQKSKGDFKVLNVGGGLDRIGVKMDAVFDLRGDELSADKADRVLARDICSKNSWVDLKDNEFDLVICTHTLEDIRDPLFAIEQMSRVGKSGFIAVPNVERELSYSRTPHYIGYAHHRWIFKVVSEKLLIAPKSNSLNYLVKRGQFSWPKKIKRDPKILFKNIIRRILFELSKFTNSKFRYFEYSEGKIEKYELAVWWDSILDFEVVNADLFLPPFDESIFAPIKEAFDSDE